MRPKYIPPRRYDARSRLTSRGPLLERIRYNATFLVLATWIVIVFLLGGGARADITSLLILRPASVLVLFWALSKLTAARVRANRTILLLAAGMVAIHLLQLIPLPPALWQSLPGRQIVVEIDQQAGLKEIWRPLSIAPYLTRNSLWTLAAPMAVLLLGIQLDARSRTALLPVLIGTGVLSGAVSVLQAMGDPRGPLYFYRLTNNGELVGLFSNRNHHAFFLATLIPMVLAWLKLGRGRAGEGSPAHRLAAYGAITFFVMLLLVNGSRMGILAAAVATLLYGVVLLRLRAGAPNPDRAPRTNRAGEAKHLLWRFALPASLGLLVLLAILLGRGVAFGRLLRTSTVDEMRVMALPSILAMVKLYMPWGTGFGTFQPVYFVHEPHELLGPTFMNHAHNDFLELILTAGIPGGLLTIFAGGWFVARVAFALTTEERWSTTLCRWLGFIVVLVLTLASVTDYPLRTPSLACLAMLAVLWATSPPEAVNRRVEAKKN